MNITTLLLDGKKLHDQKEDEITWHKTNTLFEKLCTITEPTHLSQVLIDLELLIVRSMLSDRSRLSGTTLNLLKHIIFTTGIVKDIESKDFSSKDISNGISNNKKEGDVLLTSESLAPFITPLFKLCGRSNKVFVQRGEELLLLISPTLYKASIHYKENSQSVNKNVRLCTYKSMEIYLKHNKNDDLNIIAEKGVKDAFYECRVVCKRMVKENGSEVEEKKEGMKIRRPLFGYTGDAEKRKENFSNVSNVRSVEEKKVSTGLFASIPGKAMAAYENLKRFSPFRKQVKIDENTKIRVNQVNVLNLKDTKNEDKNVKEIKENKVDSKESKVDGKELRTRKVEKVVKREDIKKLIQLSQTPKKEDNVGMVNTLTPKRLEEYILKYKNNKNYIDKKYMFTGSDENSAKSNMFDKINNDGNNNENNKTIELNVDTNSLSSTVTSSLSSESKESLSSGDIPSFMNKDEDVNIATGGLNDAKQEVFVDIIQNSELKEKEITDMEIEQVVDKEIVEDDNVTGIVIECGVMIENEVNDNEVTDMVIEQEELVEEIEVNTGNIGVDKQENNIETVDKEDVIDEMIIEQEIIVENLEDEFKFADNNNPIVNTVEEELGLDIKDNTLGDRKNTLSLESNKHKEESDKIIDTADVASEINVIAECEVNTKSIIPGQNLTSKPEKEGVIIDEGNKDILDCDTGNLCNNTLFKNIIYTENNTSFQNTIIKDNKMDVEEYDIELGQTTNGKSFVYNDSCINTSHINNSVDVINHESMHQINEEIISEKGHEIEEFANRSHVNMSINRNETHISENLSKLSLKNNLSFRKSIIEESMSKLSIHENEDEIDRIFMNKTNKDRSKNESCMEECENEIENKDEEVCMLENTEELEDVNRDECDEMSKLNVNQAITTVCTQDGLNETLYNQEKDNESIRENDEMACCNEEKEIELTKQDDENNQEKMHDEEEIVLLNEYVGNKTCDSILDITTIHEDGTNVVKLIEDNESTIEEEKVMMNKSADYTMIGEGVSVKRDAICKENEKGDELNK